MTVLKYNFLELKLLIRALKAKQKSADNPGYNILRFFDTLLNFLFTKSETKRDYY